MSNYRYLSAIFTLFFFTANAQAPAEKAPPRAEGEGPFPQLIIRGVTLINGNCAPPIGPVDIVVVDNRITEIKNVGYPGMPTDSSGRPPLQPGGHEIDCGGMYLLPGFVDMHGHIGGRAQGADEGAVRTIPVKVEADRLLIALEAPVGKAAA